MDLKEEKQYYINDESTDIAGVGWILAENWWPYQRPTFVTPPFAGYVSGHSTYSRAASEILTKITGTPFFPGGLGEFTAKQNEFVIYLEVQRFSTCKYNKLVPRFFSLKKVGQFNTNNTIKKICSTQ